MKRYSTLSVANIYLDNLDSRRVVLNSSAAVIDRYHYSAWGIATQEIGSDHYESFTGKEYDATGLIYFNARYYDPTVGRFLTEDPSRKGVNWYAYCENDPVNKVDPTGRADIGEIAGYSETGVNSWRKGNDEVFNIAANAYNQKYELNEGAAGYVSPKMLKAQAMIESGGSQIAFTTDPLQVNNPGDWDNRKADIARLQKDQTMTPEASAAAALEWRRYKGYIHDESGAETTWRGDWQANRRYNGNTNPAPDNSGRQHRDWYADRVQILSQ
jgi:RHS repeat-associated protein